MRPTAWVSLSSRAVAASRSAAAVSSSMSRELTSTPLGGGPVGTTETAWLRMPRVVVMQGCPAHGTPVRATARYRSATAAPPSRAASSSSDPPNHELAVMPRRRAPAGLR